MSDGFYRFHGLLTEVLNAVRFEHHPKMRVRYSITEGWVQLQDEALSEEFNTGRKWRISKYMTRSELVQTLFAAYMAWVEHEARESFQYQGVSIFAPHLDVDALAKFARNKSNYEYREVPT